MSDLDLHRIIYYGQPLDTPAPPSLSFAQCEVLTPEQHQRIVVEQLAHQTRLWAIGVLQAEGQKG